MRPQNRNHLLYLDDMMDSMVRIEEYIANIDFEEFTENRLVVDAVIRNFEIIGEATKHIPENLKENYTMVPWKKMYRLRNLVSPVYFGIDHDLIWEIIKTNFPENKRDLQKIIDSERSKR